MIPTDTREVGMFHILVAVLVHIDVNEIAPRVFILPGFTSNSGIIPFSAPLILKFCAPNSRNMLLQNTVYGDCTETVLSVLQHMSY